MQPSSLQRILDLVNDLLRLLLHLPGHLLDPTLPLQLRIAGQGPAASFTRPFQFIDRRHWPYRVLFRAAFDSKGPCAA